MALASLLRRPSTVALAALSLSILSAYSLGVVDAGYALTAPHLAEAFARGSFLGVPALWFVARMVGFAVFSSALALIAVGGDAASLGAASATPWRRLLASQAPLLLTPWALTQDDVLRRPAFVAFFVGLAVALTLRMRAAPAVEPDAPAHRKGLAEHWPVALVIALHALFFAAATIERDRALWSATVDLGIFKEALWHTLHGRVMFSPAVGYSFFGEHFSPVLFLLVPLYALWPSSACLLSVQTLAISASAWPLYRLGREVGLTRGLATALAAAMIFSPPMQTALFYDFHMDLLAVPALSALVLALHRRRWLHSYLALALLVSVKEDMFIPAAGAILARVFSGDRDDARRSVPAGLVATAYCFLSMFVFIRAFGPPPGVPVYMGGGGGAGPRGTYKFLRNFRHLVGWGGPLRMLFGQPVRFVLYAFTETRLTTLLNFMMPLGFLPFMARWRFALLAPLGIILLSDNPEIVSLRYHYSAIQHPGVFFAAAYGAATLVASSPRHARTQQSLAGLVVAGAVVLLGMHPASVWARTHVSDRHAVTPHVAGVDRLVARVSPNATVSVTTFLGPRLSNRVWSNVFPHGVQKVDAALVDLQRPAWPLEPGTRDETIRALLRQGWSAAAWHDGAVLLLRHGDTSHNREALRDLFARRRYEVEGTEQTEFPNCVEVDPDASDGRARVVRASDPRAPGFVVFGPFIRLFPARYRVNFRLRAEASISRDEPIGTVDVLAKNGVLIASQELLPEMFPDAQWHDVPVDFAVELGGADEVEFRVRTAKRWLLGADVISLTSPDEEALLNTMTVR